MAKRYLTKDAWRFQYALDDASPSYAAFMAQRCVATVSPAEEPSGARIGLVKTIFPGGKAYDWTEADPGLTVDFLLNEGGSAILNEGGFNIILG